MNNNKILDLHKLRKQKFIENEISVKDLEYQKAFEFSYLIEPYDNKMKDMNFGKIFESFNIKLKIKDNTENPPRSIITITENDDELKFNNKDLLLQKKR